MPQLKYLVSIVISNIDGILPEPYYKRGLLGNGYLLLRYLREWFLFYFLLLR